MRYEPPTGERIDGPDSGGGNSRAPTPLPGGASGREAGLLVLIKPKAFDILER